MIRRNTNQKQIVYDSLQVLGHASSEALIEYIKNNFLNISLATIYRNLTILMEDNLVKKVKLNGIDVYETVKQKHYHYLCKECQNIIDITPGEIGIKLESLANIKTGSIDDCDVMLYGVCKECQNK